MGMQLTEFLILGFAVHRAITIWSADDLLKPLREWTFKTRVAPITRCPFCISVWFAAFFYLLWCLGWLAQIPIIVLGVSGVAVFMEMILRK